LRICTRTDLPVSPCIFVCRPHTSSDAQQLLLTSDHERSTFSHARHSRHARHLTIDSNHLHSISTTGLIRQSIFVDYQTRPYTALSFMGRTTTSTPDVKRHPHGFRTLGPSFTCLSHGSSAAQCSMRNMDALMPITDMCPFRDTTSDKECHCPRLPKLSTRLISHMLQQSHAGPSDN
jgi:hypothetical protein